MTVRIVLDTSALLAYARLQGQAVGELVNGVAEDPGGIVGVPAACYLSAHERLPSEERAILTRFVTAIDGVTAILPLLGADTVEVAEFNAAIPSQVGMGHAIIEARRHGVMLATYAGHAARTEMPSNDVLDLVD